MDSSLALAYTAKVIGEHTSSSQDGKEKARGTSDGQKQLDSGSSHVLLPTMAHEATTIRSMATLKELSKDGEMGKAEIDP
ncbi:hypothetical protein VKT23_020084 [Stygiomarasmius scandens]|uniref:Uncharacterized protein n=1 Tax=Marasmiellus scandens TaxID=2682957 RepID=A0ABR1IJS1_9AGAR